MNKIEEILSTPVTPFVIGETECTDSIGNWRSKISFLNGEESFPHLSTVQAAVSPKKQFESEIVGAGKKVSKKAQLDTAIGIRNSFVPRPDLKIETQFSAFSEKPYISHYRMLHNGHVPGAINSSYDRVSPKMTMARQMTAEEAGGRERTICYAGRADTWDKAIELAGLIFQGQLRCGQAIERKEGVYQLKFAVNSSLSLLAGMPEYKFAKKEWHIFKKLSGQVISLKKTDGTDCLVKCEPIFFSEQFNVCSTLEKLIPASKSGKDNARLLSAGVTELVQFLGTEKAHSPEIAPLIKMLNHPNGLSSIESLFCRILLFKRAGIPLVIHCKSSVDRTAIAAAIAYALDQWEQSGLPLPSLPYQILQKNEFKELFLAHIHPAHYMTFYSRGGKSLDEGFGFKWHQELSGSPLFFTQHPGMLSLIPDRMKKLYFAPLKQMGMLPGGTLIGLRNILHHFGSWITAQDEAQSVGSRILVASCRALFLVPLMIKCLVESIFIGLIHPRYLKALYLLSPEKIVPTSTQLNNRPLLLSGKGE